MGIGTSELCDRYEALYSGAVADSLDALGYELRALPTDLMPLSPGQSVAGVAYPVEGWSNPDGEYDSNIRSILRMLGDAPENSVLITEARDDTAAHLGELSTTALHERGCRGAVIDGGTRDVQFIRNQEFPVFARYRTPVDAPPRWKVAEWDVPVQIDGIEINPRDVIVGDDDGILCVPRDHAEEVLEYAEDKVSTESEIREAVEQGMDPLDAYDEFGTF